MYLINYTRGNVKVMYVITNNNSGIIIITIIEKKI